MKKSLKIYLLLWVGVLFFIVLLVVITRMGLLTPHHRLAQDPTNIEIITGLDLPNPISVNSQNNLGRGASGWDCFEHRSQFSEKLSDELIGQLEIKCKTDSVHWHKNDTIVCYKYLDDAWNSGGIYCISCRIYEDYSHVEYYVDEVEGFINFGYGMLPILLIVFILLVWGMVLIVKIIVRKCRNSKEISSFANKNEVL